MIIFTGQIDPPPPLPMTDEERLKAEIEARARDDSWVEGIIDGLAGDLRDVKH